MNPHVIPHTRSVIHALHLQRDRARRHAVICYFMFMPCGVYTLTRLALIWIPESLVSSVAKTIFDQPLLWSVMAVLSVLTLTFGMVESARAKRLEFYKDPQQIRATRDILEVPHIHALMLQLMRQQKGIFEFQIRKLQQFRLKEDHEGYPVKPNTQPQS